jgi:hypothetical protein
VIRREPGYWSVSWFDGAKTSPPSLGERRDSAEHWNQDTPAVPDPPPRSGAGSDIRPSDAAPTHMAMLISEGKR